MPFKSEKQRKWMHANKPKIAKKWEKEETIKKLREIIRMELEGSCGYTHTTDGEKLDTPGGVGDDLEEDKKRDYKDEYKKFQSSDKSKKYRAELNKYNRKKGTYGNGDGKDASHKGGKIVGFEAESKNRGRAEKRRLKKESSSAYGKSIEKIANKMSGNMTGAVKAIEKLKKGLSKDKKVADALRQANESVNEGLNSKGF